MILVWLWNEKLLLKRIDMSVVLYTFNQFPIIMLLPMLRQLNYLPSDMLEMVYRGSSHVAAIPAGL